MKKVLSVILALAMFLSLAVVSANAEDITLDVIIAQYGPNTQEWFLGKGMDGSNFVEKFEAANPGIKLNLKLFPGTTCSRWFPRRSAITTLRTS